MKKTVKLAEDGFVRATEISRLLEDGWTIHPTDDPREIVAEKAGLDENTGTTGPIMLLD